MDYADRLINANHSDRFRAPIMVNIRSTLRPTMPIRLIAPCGMNCRLCRAYIRDGNTCPGCRGDDRLKAQYCVTCKIKNCAKFANGKVKYCSGCDSFPCAKLKRLDKRYRTKYGMSMVDNLEDIKKLGIRQFIRNEKEKWACPVCNETICVHKPQCLACNYQWHKKPLE